MHFATGLEVGAFTGARGKQAGSAESKKVAEEGPGEEEADAEEEQKGGRATQPTLDALPAVSGLRANSEVLIWVNVPRSMAAPSSTTPRVLASGATASTVTPASPDETTTTESLNTATSAGPDIPPLKWWRSSNGVILTEGNERGFVPLDFVEYVERRVPTRGLKAGNGERSVIWRRADGGRDDEVKGAERANGEHGAQAIEEAAIQVEKV